MGININARESIFPRIRFDKIVPLRDPVRRVSAAISISAVFQLWAHARGFSRVCVTALLACRRGIDWLKLTPTLPSVNANWRRPNWIIGGNAMDRDVNISLAHPHLYPHIIVTFVLVSFTPNFSIYLLSDLLTYPIRYINATNFSSLRQYPELIFFHQSLYPLFFDNFLFHYEGSDVKICKNLWDYLFNLFFRFVHWKLNITTADDFAEKFTRIWGMSWSHQSLIFVRNPSRAHHYLDWMMYDVINGYFAVNCSGNYDFSACISSQRCTATAKTTWKGSFK